MILKNRIYIISQNEEEFKKLFLILTTHFKEDILCIEDYETWPIIYIFNNTVHGCKNIDFLLGYDFKEVSSKIILENY